MGHSTQHAPGEHTGAVATAPSAAGVVRSVLEKRLGAQRAMSGAMLRCTCVPMIAMGCEMCYQRPTVFAITSCVSTGVTAADSCAVFAGLDQRSRRV